MNNQKLKTCLENPQSEFGVDSMAVFTGKFSCFGWLCQPHLTASAALDVCGAGGWEGGCYS